MQTVEQHTSETLHLCPEQLLAAHLAESASMIRLGAKVADGDRAAVLGCGSCAEIPIEDLSQAFTCVDLVELETAAVEAVQQRVEQDADLRRAVRIRQADLTGLLPQLRLETRDIVQAAADPLRCLGELGKLLGSTTPMFWTSPEGEEYDFIVCSAVLTQLQAKARAAVESEFLARFSDFRFAISTHERWRRATWQFARELEDAFISHLEQLATPGGIVYLSDTVHVSWLVERGPETFETPGAWIATRSSRLRDYLNPWSEVIAEKAWPWILRKKEGPYWGRLYGCQALLYRVNTP